MGKDFSYLKDVEIADSFFKRLKGLTFRKEIPDDYGLYFKDTNRVHSHFMKVPITVVYLSSDNVVIDKERLYPFKLGKKVTGCYNILEMSVDNYYNVEVGDKLEI